MLNSSLLKRTFVDNEDKRLVMLTTLSSFILLVATIDECKETLKYTVTCLR